MITSFNKSTFTGTMIRNGKRNEKRYYEKLVSQDKCQSKIHSPKSVH